MRPELIKFLVTKTDLNEKEMKPELHLAKDIGFYGLDAVDFFEKFFDHFEIKNLDDFEEESHIDGSVDFKYEGQNWFKNIFRKDREKYLNPDVSIGHLNKVVEAGKWFNER